MHAYGLYGDRYCAFYDETKQGWASFITARDIPEMLGYQAKLVDGVVNVTAPNGERFSWNDELLQEIQKKSRRKISMSGYQAPHPTRSNLMSVDQASILVITDSSLRHLERIWGKKVDRRRFRANLLLSLDGKHNERDWIGKHLLFGDAVLEVQASCERCSLITIDPDTCESDFTLLGTVYEELDLSFGVYARVRKTGHIQVGQTVYVTD
ncbi:hypothetical protein XYCOK13_24960 [Xylanibacillus composti]|uniref:MOSC domain-containing protein n=1 Tax=Xylanibacillus composti TaxID=1572762 RepID=A0A8J4H529_9BACL|nr:hypothetical protein XYCOK13_24960 [Xylanibacillus composti]